MRIDDRHDTARREHAPCDEPALRARADRLVGLWAAAQLGLGEGEAETYADAVVQAGLAAPGDHGGFDKVAGDLAATAIHVEAIRTRYALAMSDVARPFAPAVPPGYSLAL